MSLESKVYRSEAAGTDLWREIAALPEEQHTLSRGQSFRIREVNRERIILVLSNNREIRITRDELLSAFDSLERNGELRLKEIDVNFAYFKSAYVAALLAQLPGVEYSTRPISLRMRRQS